MSLLFSSHNLSSKYKTMVQHAVKQYNEDELVAPAWLNEAYFQNVLSQHEGGAAVELQELHITPGTVKGDHFASVMFRVQLKYRLATAGPALEERQQTLIVKTMPEVDGIKKQILEARQLFETEIDMYTVVLPKVQQLLTAAGDKTQICAKLLHHALAPQKCIAFEDLTQFNYSAVWSRNCTVAEVKLALSKLAKFHAATYKMLNEEDATLLQHKQKSHVAANTKQVNKHRSTFFTTGLNLFKNAVRQCDALREYLPVVERLDVETVMERENASRSSEAGEILVLLHADFHMKNFMTRYNGDELDDLILLDFQLSHYGSIVRDLIYAYFMLFSAEMRRDMRDELFGYHLLKFQKALKQFGYSGDIPTHEEFAAELKRCKYYEICTLANFLVAGYCLSQPNGDISGFIGGETRQELYKNPAILQEFSDLLPRYVHEGYFD